METAPVFIPDNAINPEPGPYSFDRTPYLRELVDWVIDQQVRELWFYKPTQVGFTRLIISLILYFVDQDPGALGLLMPDEDSVEEIFGEELKPTIDATPAARRHKTGRAWDNTKDEIWLDTMPIFGLYAGSVQRLARRSLRYALLDEIDKYRPFTREASPIQLLKKRTSNWLHRARLIAGSTPTTGDGNIALGYAACPDKREYFVPCWRCGFYQTLLWSQVRGFRDAKGGNKNEKANWVRLNQPAHYVCVNCKKEIEQASKAEVVAAGRWAGAKDEKGEFISQNRSYVEDGELRGEQPPAVKIGAHLNSLVSPWLSWSELAAEFIEAEGDIDKTRDFRNARLALPWDEVVKSVRPSAVRDKKPISGPKGIVPAWAVGLYATFDTQKDWFAGTIRAWGWGYRSALVWHGECQSFEEVFKLGLESQFLIDGRGGEVFTPTHLLIDSGGMESRTSEVYEFALRDSRIVACKGASHPMKRPWHLSRLDNGIWLLLHDTNHYKDMLARLVADPEPTKWLPHNEVSEQYCLEMASERKVVNPRTRRHEWVPTGTARQEAWDCEELQCVAADMANVGLAPPPPPPPPQTPPGDGAVRPDWMPERPTGWMNR
jgi:phage terminase large subunit GpA-like protein